MMRSVVDLPQPDGPSSTQKLPARDVQVDAFECLRVAPSLGDVDEPDG